MNDNAPCEECGLEPLWIEKDGHTIRVDGCFGAFLGQVISACCGHGGRKPAYVRICQDSASEYIDICGGKIVDYLTYSKGLK